jgi:hypothetical protein
MNIHGSVILRKEIVKRFKDNSLSYYEISKQIGVEYKFLIMWLNANNGGKDKKAMPDSAITKLCSLLGIELRGQVVVLHPMPLETLKTGVNKQITANRLLTEEKKRNLNEAFFKDDENEFQ